MCFPALPPTVQPPSARVSEASSKPTCNSISLFFSLSAVRKMAGRDVARRKSVARRLWRVARAVLYMLRRGVLRPAAGRKLAVDLGLLLRRGKIAGGKVLLGFHNHSSQQSGFSSSARSSSFSSCRSFDVHEPSARRGSTRRDREVEFSCSNTPFSAAADPRRHYTNAGGFGYDAADIAKVFEILNLDDDDDNALALAVASTPSPALLWRTLSSSSTPVAAAGEEQQQVDRKADEFIRRFYEQLRAQKSAAATPDSYGHSPRPRLTD
ncbi:uncharacterized protein LOC100825519 [Brachypodium distachyon]|uniref:Uncharacterized protein n=1 Tax=Brachypodium distachyon TaxID=15368 RepID=A0A2K2CW15_BRADI|nr:uncharacterized protein LOC100825519 [Brachypodium distachyon]PNT66217.1 hypothetical protein BRADI_3g08740v3 [Brachypodium distachyon]|eukprot:XP_014756173.1 uncharacterized protein LOC100825519 [Brachypodium distachyon]